MELGRVVRNTNLADNIDYVS